ncbi:hypothetical protein N7471_009115 [Penicillium samsonianum]|uniref:uncharacterized protein n=1 Tax=Penicillium samsonianum TaxID=1882272 RepID=UPI002547444F|nr:uncharacterized protein N7471_009115 [Penicillium samsonianum]KAJ6127898.1 hypothetical protein N7471_009115 [Penicillium samsonianum]
MAVNIGLAVGLSIGLVIPLTIALIILAVTYSHRSCPFRHPKLPQPDACQTKNTENWLNLYHATRPLSLTEKTRSILEVLRLVRKPIVQEVYVMENGTKVSK